MGVQKVDTMPYETAKNTLDTLKAELDQHPDDDGLQDRIRGVRDDLGSHPPDVIQGLIQELTHAAETFEVEHPQTSRAIHQAIAALTALGL
jgi:hypothetical protein